MSWTAYRKLLDTRSADPAAWQAAHQANLNEQETALFDALNDMLTEVGDDGLYDIAVLMLKLAKAAAQVQVPPPWDGNPLVDW